MNIAKKEKRIGDTRWGDRDSRQETKRLAASLFRLDGFSASCGRGLAVLGVGAKSAVLGVGARTNRQSRRRSLELSTGDTESRTGSKAAGWSAAIADGLQLLGLNPLKGTIDGAPKFWGPGAVEPLALGQNRACVRVTDMWPRYLLLLGGPWEWAGSVQSLQ